VVLTAARESSTDATRGLLPAHVPFADAVFTASRTALAVHAFTREPGLLLDATEDRLHQGYRRPAYPESVALVERLREHRIPAVISGAGPSVLALPTAGSVPTELVGDGFTICPTPVDSTGVQVEDR
jgi:homoserine kinase